MTLSEYGGELICDDLARVEHREYAMRALLNAQEEIQPGEMQQLSAFDALDAKLADEFRSLQQKSFSYSIIE